jgi:hypothetical protein
MSVDLRSTEECNSALQFRVLGRGRSFQLASFVQQIQRLAMPFPEGYPNCFMHFKMFFLRLDGRSAIP